MSDHFFTSSLLRWFTEHGRHDLPWQIQDDPYKVWVSEIMLQQTQVKTVLNYYSRFIARFPDVNSLAQATWDEVAPYWAGLGYYARARNLHKAAQQVVASGRFPDSLEGWMELSGIGRSTGGALMSLGIGKFGVIMDGNVKRVLARYFAIEGDLSKPIHEKPLWQLAESLVPEHEHAAYTQAIMDLGATICTPKKPLCLYCPMREHCQAYKIDRVLDFPQKKIKKEVPVRQANVLIISNDTQSLWLKRPAEGLWGGLYSLPIIEDAQEFENFCQQWNIQSVHNFEIQHQFTHFTWQLSCYQFMVDHALLMDLNRELKTETFSINEIKSLALPTAMKKILKQFALIQENHR